MKPKRTASVTSVAAAVPSPRQLCVPALAQARSVRRLVEHVRRAHTGEREISLDGVQVPAASPPGALDRGDENPGGPGGAFDLQLATALVVDATTPPRVAPTRSL